MGLPGGASGKEPKCQCRRHETRVRSVGQEGPLEEGMGPYSSILAWRMLSIEEPGGLQSVHRVAKSLTQLKLVSTHGDK